MTVRVINIKNQTKGQGRHKIQGHPERGHVMLTEEKEERGHGQEIDIEVEGQDLETNNDKDLGQMIGSSKSQVKEREIGQGQQKER